MKNGRYARPTSDRSFAGAIAEAHSLLMGLSKWRGLVVGRRMGEVEVVGRGGWGGALDGTKNRVRS